MDRWQQNSIYFPDEAGLMYCSPLKKMHGSIHIAKVSTYIMRYLRQNSAAKFLI